MPARSYRECTIQDCRRKYHSRGYCTFHYHKWRKQGDPYYVGTKRGTDTGTSDLITTDELRKLIRNFAEWYALYEDVGMDEINLPTGYVLSIHDVFGGWENLTPLQQKAVASLYIYGFKDVECREMFGYHHAHAGAISNYATKGLRKLVSHLNTSLAY